MKMTRRQLRRLINETISEAYEGQYHGRTQRPTFSTYSGFSLGNLNRRLSPDEVSSIPARTKKSPEQIAASIKLQDDTAVKGAIKAVRKGSTFKKSDWEAYIRRHIQFMPGIVKSFEDLEAAEAIVKDTSDPDLYHIKKEDAVYAEHT